MTSSFLHRVVRIQLDSSSFERVDVCHRADMNENGIRYAFERAVCRIYALFDMEYELIRYTYIIQRAWIS